MSQQRKAKMRKQNKKMDESARKQWLGFAIILVMILSAVVAIVAMSMK